MVRLVILAWLLFRPLMPSIGIGIRLDQPAPQGGSGAPTYTPALQFNDARNSQYTPWAF